MHIYIYIYINTYIPNYPKPTSWSSSEVLRYKPRQVGGMVRCERSITEHPWFRFLFHFLFHFLFLVLFLFMTCVTNSN